MIKTEFIQLYEELAVLNEAKQDHQTFIPSFILKLGDFCPSSWPLIIKTL